MKMRKSVITVLGILCICGGFSGCGKRAADTVQTAEEDWDQSGSETDEDRQVTKLVWQGDETLKKHEAYFNQVLKEKNVPCEVTFVDGNAATGGQKADLKEIPQDWKETYDMTEEILSGEFLALDEWLSTEEGKAIKESLPENVWDVYQVDGKQYTVLSVGFIPTKVVYIWDRELAEKYDVHPERWSEKIWEYESELKKVRDGERDTAGFLTVQGLTLYGESLPDMTKILGVCYPFVIRETDKTPTAELLYETPEYREYLSGVQKLYESGICVLDKDLDYELEQQPFLKIYTDFVSKDGYGRYWKLPEDYWDTHEVKEIWTKPLWRLNCNAKEVGILADSAHQKEAFLLLCRLYEDAELINALMWGKRDSDFQVVGNTAEALLSGGYIPAVYVGNNFLAYAEVGQDENKKELYPKWLSEREKSQIAGFEFSGNSCKEELEQIYGIYDTANETGEDRDSFLEENEEKVRQYKEAGADQVIREWNRQYAAWKEGTADGIKN